MDAHEFPVLLAAWRQAYDERNPGAAIPQKLQTFLDETDAAARKELIREIYEFLHAQQLCAITSQMHELNTKVEGLRLPASSIVGTISKGLFLFLSGIVVGNLIFSTSK